MPFQLNAVLARAGNTFSRRTAFLVDNNQANHKEHLEADASRVKFISSMMFLEADPTFYKNVVNDTEMLKAAKSDVKLFFSSPANDS